MKKYIGTLSILLTTLTTCIAQAADWKSDKAASKLDYVAIYEKAETPGTFKDFDTKLVKFDPQKPAGAQLEVTVKTSSADLNSRDMNDAVKETEWFDVAHFPQATFLSKDIKRTADGKYVANGKLKIKNVEKDVSVPFTWTGNGDAASMQGELTLNRVSYNVGTGDWSNGDSIGLDVKVRFNVKLVKAK